MGNQKKPAHELMLEDLQIWIKWVNRVANEDDTPSNGLYIFSLNTGATKTMHFLKHMALPEDARLKVIEKLEELLNRSNEPMAIKLLKALITDLQGEPAQSDDGA